MGFVDQLNERKKSEQGVGQREGWPLAANVARVVKQPEHTVIKLAQAEVSNPDSPFYNESVVQDVFSKEGNQKYLGTEIKSDLVLKLIMDGKLEIKEQDFAKMFAEAQKNGTYSDKDAQSGALDKLMQRAGLAGDTRSR